MGTGNTLGWKKFRFFVDESREDVVLPANVTCSCCLGPSIWLGTASGLALSAAHDLSVRATFQAHTQRVDHVAEAPVSCAGPECSRARTWPAAPSAAAARLLASLSPPTHPWQARLCPSAPASAARTHWKLGTSQLADHPKTLLGLCWCWRRAASC